MTVLVTGGAGFIGSALVLHLMNEGAHEVATVDALTYAAHPESLKSLENDPRHRFIEADITDVARMRAFFGDLMPDAVIHLAAETHVDRSITGSGAFIRTNVLGTHVLLEVAKGHWERLKGEKKERFRFVHVSTDEVFGALGEKGCFTEDSAYAPRSPYAASKASSDHLARAWFHTYGLPVVVTNCTNNYGPRQFPEKLIPLMILNALDGKPLPLYGDGAQVRDWLHVDDHARALVAAWRHGVPGETYAIGARTERTNREIVTAICSVLDRLRPDHAPHERLIAHVADRPGHDRRYAIDPSRAERELGWNAKIAFEDGLKSTIRWYLDHEAWWRPLQDVYGRERLGLPR